MKDVSKLSLKQKIGINLHNKYRETETKLHQLKYLMWEATLRCNLNCIHCGSDCKTDSSVKDMPLNDFLEVIDSITPYLNPKKTMLVLTGGEVLLRKDLEIAGKEFYKRTFPWGIVTNGHLLTKEKFETLLKSGLRSITVSLDGLEESHNKIRKNNDSFNRVYKALKYIADEKSIISDVVTTVNQINFNELEDIKNLLIDIGIKNWRIFTTFPIGRAAENEILQLPNEKFRQVFNFIEDNSKDKRINISYGCEGWLGKYETKVRKGFYFCRAGINVASVLVDGAISACTNINHKFIQGNIYDHDFWEVWNNKFEIYRNRSWTKNGICSDCKEYKNCLGNGIHLRNENNELLLCHLEKLK